MFTNHHIAMQLAAERQRELRGADRGRSLPGRFATGAAERLAAPALFEVRFPAPAAGREEHLPDPRIRRSPAGQSATRAGTPHQHREPRRSAGRSSDRVGS
jgi:hypothetical protein